MLQVCSLSLTTRSESLPRAYGDSTGLPIAHHTLDPHSLLLTEKQSHLLKFDLSSHLHRTKRRRHHTERVSSHLQKKCKLNQITNHSQHPALKFLQARSEAERKVPMVMGSTIPCWMCSGICNTADIVTVMN
jgi:hypothetical protein